MSVEILAAPSSSEIRDEMQALILGELLGPAGGPEEEVTEARLTERYILGMLAPAGTRTTAEEDDSLAVQGDVPVEEGESEPDVSPIPTIFPSSLGMTFRVEGAVTRLHVIPAWGRYTREEPRGASESDDRPSRVWKRHPMGGNPVDVDLREGELEAKGVDPEGSGVVIRGRARSHDGDWLVTLFLVNRQTVPKQLRDEAWLFQAEFAVQDPGARAIFLQRPAPEEAEFLSGDTQESRSLEMLYRDHLEFAVGHGASVHADLAPDDPSKAVRLVTRAVPGYDVPRTDPPMEEDLPAIADITLDMKVLAEASDEELPKLLIPLVEAYDAWIEGEKARVGDAASRLSGYEEVAAVSLEQCRRAASRIRAGIELLAADAVAAQAFRFANRAMWLQRLHTLAAKDRRRDLSQRIEEFVAERDLSESRTWRPFQLAFVLLNLPALTRASHPERAGDGEGLVDLLWFPTGGGKTEAYLGLTAFTLAIRRLQGDVAGFDGRDGVAVIMRYTLRLLTIQQFQRAATLLCACEVIRRERAAAGDHLLGETPFRIGLWVGQRATPNTTDQADEWLKQARGATGFRQGGQSGSPAQLTSCPWCGTAIDEKKHIKVDMTVRRTFLYCGDSYGRCPFSEKQAQLEGLPVVVVDEEIYRRLPGLLIGTVDKFAQLPWRGPVQTLFGRVTGRCERHGFRSPDLDDSDSHHKHGAHPPAKTVPAGPLRPPDLIVQDELHLIAGPLGTMVGLYETVVDRLCAWNLDGTTVRPKVIASTATVRRAPAQTHALFWRRLEVFPPPGLDASDSFFAMQRKRSEETPGRRYLGICAHGRQFKNVLIRVYVAQMAAAQSLFEKYGSAADPWMTLIGYFNSLKDLGGMRRHVDDDVSARLGRIDRRGLARRPRPEVEELTSRRGSADIPRVLDRLEQSFAVDPPKGQRFPIDVLLATNMISVGIDIPRLGTMVVAGQPKATAEYIQATSRIGREAPGLVLTVYGWARPRDLSHYERFEHYHATIYRHVEALSVTPFAARAMDRGLTALLVSLIRQLEITWNPEPAAKAVDTRSALAKEAIETIKERAMGVRSLADIGDQIEAALHQRLDSWDAQQAIEGRQLAYRDRRDGVTVGLLRNAGVTGWDTWTCLWSLRDVEPGINLILDQDDLGEGDAPAYEASHRDGDAGTGADGD